MERSNQHNKIFKANMQKLIERESELQSGLIRARDLERERQRERHRQAFAKRRSSIHSFHPSFCGSNLLQLPETKKLDKQDLPYFKSAMQNAKMMASSQGGSMAGSKEQTGGFITTDSDDSDCKVVRVKYTGCDRRKSVIIEVADLSQFANLTADSGLDSSDTDKEKANADHTAYVSSLDEIERTGRAQKQQEEEQQKQAKAELLANSLKNNLSLGRLTLGQLQALDATTNLNTFPKEAQPQKPGQLPISHPDSSSKLAFERVKLQLCKDVRISTDSEFEVLGYSKIDLEDRKDVYNDSDLIVKRSKIILKLRVDERDIIHAAVDQEKSAANKLGKFAFSNVRFGETEKSAMIVF